MANYIETRIRYEKIMENGKMKRVTESFLVNALTFTEAEARIVKEMTPYISGEFTVSAVKKTDIAEIFYDHKSDFFYLVKVGFITINEKTGAETRNISNILVQAVDFKDAFDKFERGMGDTISDYDIVSLAETKILDVYEVEGDANGL